jgi:hypothetical protein
MFADVAHHQPAAGDTVGTELFDKLDVAPVNAIQALGVIIAIAAELAHAAVLSRELIPFFAGDLTGFAANTDGGIRVKAHRLCHHAFSTLHTKALPS